MRISDWSSDVCSSDLLRQGLALDREDHGAGEGIGQDVVLIIEGDDSLLPLRVGVGDDPRIQNFALRIIRRQRQVHHQGRRVSVARSEEHTSELQSLMRISYAVFCLKTKKTIALTM